MVFSAHIVSHSPFNVGLVVSFDDGKNWSGRTAGIASSISQDVTIIEFLLSNSAYSSEMFKNQCYIKSVATVEFAYALLARE